MVARSGAEKILTIRKTEQLSLGLGELLGGIEAHWSDADIAQSKEATRSSRQDSSKISDK